MVHLWKKTEDVLYILHSDITSPMTRVVAGYSNDTADRVIPPSSSNINAEGRVGWVEFRNPDLLICALTINRKP